MRIIKEIIQAHKESAHPIKHLRFGPSLESMLHAPLHPPPLPSFLELSNQSVILGLDWIDEEINRYSFILIRNNILILEGKK